MNNIYSLRRGAFAATELVFCGTSLGPVAEHYFEPPSGERADMLIGLQGKYQRTTECRRQRHYVSAAAFGEEREVVDGGSVRKHHSILRSASFGVHPEFGTGHVLETNGDVAAFWNGEGTYLVRLENVEMVGVVLDGGAADEKTKPVKTSAVSRALAALESLL